MQELCWGSDLGVDLCICSSWHLQGASWNSQSFSVNNSWEGPILHLHVTLYSAGWEQPVCARMVTHISGSENKWRYNRFEMPHIVQQVFKMLSQRGYHIQFPLLLMWYRACIAKIRPARGGENRASNSHARGRGTNPIFTWSNPERHTPRSGMWG